MNVVFHTLAGLTIGQTAATRLDTRRGGVRAPLRTGAIAAAVLVLGVLSHGVLDGLKHYYPFRARGDTLATAALFIGWLAMVPRRLWWPFIVGVAAAMLPDIVDHVPRDLNRHLGWHLPDLPPLFPWHWRESGASLSGPGPPRLHLVSLANHAIVVGICAALLWVTRGVLRRPGRAAADGHLPVRRTVREAAGQEAERGRAADEAKASAP
jgi:hypothetical protein